MSQAGLLDRWTEHVGRWTLNAMGFRSRFFETCGGNMHHFDYAGDPEKLPIVLLHGISSGAVPFGRLMYSLKKHGSRIVAPDAAGHGFTQTPPESMTPDLMLDSIFELLDAVLDRPAILFGNSMGGGMAIRYALHRPENVAGLILSSPAGAPMDDEAYDEFLEIFRMNSVADGQQFVNTLFHHTPWFSFFLARYTMLRFQRPEIRSLISNVNADMMLTEEHLAALEMPIVLLWGESERLLPEQQFAFFRENLPNHAKVERVTGVGHIPHLERPEDLAKHILSFIKPIEDA